MIRSYTQRSVTQVRQCAAAGVCSPCGASFTTTTATASAASSLSMARASVARFHPLLSSRPRPLLLSPVVRASFVRHASITTTPTTASEFDHELHDLLDALQLLVESPRFESSNLDINLADGVLSVSSPAHGTWVLNKHTPTRQIWLSSPISGPRKYNFHAEKRKSDAIGEGWRGERDTEEQLKQRLIDEWSQSFSVQIDSVEDFQTSHQD